MKRSVLTGAAVAVAVATLAPAAQAQTSPTASPNLTHVKNITYELRYGQTRSYGTDIEFAEVQNSTHAFAGSYHNGLQIFDLRDPAAPEKVGVYDCAISQGDVQIFTRDDAPGRTFATYTADSSATAARAKSGCFEEAEALGFTTRQADGRGKQGTFILDVSNPENPKTVSFVEVPKGSHNQTVHPSGKWMYNSNSELITNIASSSIEIISLEDITKPTVHRTFELLKIPASLGNDSHDITFSADGTRAYSAALSHEEILDTTNPGEPKRVGTIVDPTINVFHQSDPITIGNRRVLVIEDEYAGAAGGGQCPNGGVHFYDITGANEAAPVKLGYWNIDEVRPTNDPALGRCTAHVFRLHDEQDLMTIAFYNGGVRVVDLKSVTGIGLGSAAPAGGAKQLAFSRFANSDAWSAKTPSIEKDGSFYLYANDMNRGLDVFRYTATAPKSLSKGRWMTAGESFRKLRLSAKKRSHMLRGYKLACMLPSKK